LFIYYYYYCYYYYYYYYHFHVYCYQPISDNNVDCWIASTPTASNQSTRSFSSQRATAAISPSERSAVAQNSSETLALAARSQAGKSAACTNLSQKTRKKPSQKQVHECADRSIAACVRSANSTFSASMMEAPRLLYSERRIENFVMWLTERGANLDGLEIKPSSGGLGVFATRDFVSGHSVRELIGELPAALVFDPLVVLRYFVHVYLNIIAA
jgi:hypothetical protein